MFEKIVLICEAKTDDLTELARMIAPEDRAFLRGAKLDGLDLRGKDLSGFDLTGVSYQRVLVDENTLVDPAFEVILSEARVDQASERQMRSVDHFSRALEEIAKNTFGDQRVELLAALRKSACIESGEDKTRVKPNEVDRCYSANDLSAKYGLATEELWRLGIVLSKAQAIEYLNYAGPKIVEKEVRKRATGGSYKKIFGRPVSKIRQSHTMNAYTYGELAVLGRVPLSFAAPNYLDRLSPRFDPRNVFLSQAPGLVNQPYLLGRREERATLENSILKNDITAVIGQRGIGKTSLGMAVFQSSTETRTPESDFYDAIWVRASRGSIYDAILRRLVEIERNDGGENVSPTLAQAVKGSISNLLKRDALITSQAQATSFMREVIAKLVRSLPRRLVIFVDDFDAADEGEQSAILALRDLGIGVCIFSTSPNHIEREVWHSISERNGSLLRLEGLNRSDFEEIYTRANASLRDADVSVRFSTSFIDTAWHYSGGMPYLAQLIGMSALEDWLDKGTGKPELVDKDARNALPSILHRLDFSRAGRDGGILRNLSTKTLEVFWTIAHKQDIEFETDRVLKNSGSTTIEADLKALVESGYLFDEHGKLRFADNNARLQILMLYEQEKGHLPKGESDKLADLF